DPQLAYDADLQKLVEALSVGYRQTDGCRKGLWQAEYRASVAPAAEQQCRDTALASATLHTNRGYALDAALLAHFATQTVWHSPEEQFAAKNLVDEAEVAYKEASAAKDAAQQKESEAADEARAAESAVIEARGRLQQAQQELGDVVKALQSFLQEGLTAGSLPAHRAEPLWGQCRRAVELLPSEMIVRIPVVRPVAHPQVNAEGPGSYAAQESPPIVQKKQPEDWEMKQRGARELAMAKARLLADVNLVQAVFHEKRA
ncbi:unnamed protein product, partial [Polarella glacialis]